MKNIIFDSSRMANLRAQKHEYLQWIKCRRFRSKIVRHTRCRRALQTAGRRRRKLSTENSFILLGGSDVTPRDLDPYSSAQLGRHVQQAPVYTATCSAEQSYCDERRPKKWWCADRLFWRTGITGFEYSCPIIGIYRVRPKVYRFFQLSSAFSWNLKAKF